jgi:hypothetical protein
VDETTTATATPTDTVKETPPPTETSTETESRFDTKIKYTTHIQNGASGKYDLPELLRDDWKWIVIDFEVIEGQLDMEDVWFNGLFETRERYYTVSKRTDRAEDGIDARGTVRQGGRGLILHQYPPSPASELIGPKFTATDTRIVGDGFTIVGPDTLYPPVTLEYSIKTAQNPDILPDEHKADQEDTWAVVNLNIINGELNLEDVWFRSRLLTESRIYECDHTSQFAERGVQARGLVKDGFSANALYKIPKD